MLMGSAVWIFCHSMWKVMRVQCCVALTSTGMRRDTCEEQIFETSDPELVRKLHTIRAGGRVFEREQRRWIITRITPGEPSADGELTWVVWGRIARNADMANSQISRSI